MAPKIIFKTDPVPERAIVLDTESTGFTPTQGHKMVEIGAHELVRGELTGRSFHSYLDPCRNVPQQASNVHGLTRAFLTGKPRFKDILGDLLEFLGDPSTPVWAHNAAFDKRFIAAEMDAAGHTFAHEMPCSLKLAKALPTNTADDKLETLAAAIDYRWQGRGAHSALADAGALSAVLIQLLWPLEAEAARNGAQAAPKASPKSTPKPKPAQVPVAALPAGFTPLTPDQDDRIRRYDELSVDGKLFARGQRWDANETNRLVARFLDDRASIEALVAEHGRSPGALILKLEGLGIIAPDHPYTRR